MMKKNMGTTDRVIRAMVGLFVLSLLFWGPKSYFALIGIMPLITSLTGFCMPYKIFGITTCSKTEVKA